MLQKLKSLFNKEELLRGMIGIERETLRVYDDGNLSFSHHPEVFGDKAHNAYITTDFSESQIEMITPVFDNVKDVYNFINGLYDIVALEIGDEYLWPQSMPCIMPEDGKIPVANYKDFENGNGATEYREMLLKKYGGKKQLISGIHYNFSFSEDLIKKLYVNSEEEVDYKTFKNNIYLKLTRNYLRYRWLVIYLLGAASVVDISYTGDCINKYKTISKRGCTNSGVISYRNGNCGYKNKIDLFPSYNSVDDYIDSLHSFINDNLISSHKELYSQVRLKPKDVNNFMNSLKNDGIKYLEYRSIDINPFEKGGIALEDLQFLQLFNIYLLVKKESDYSNWQQEAQENQQTIARYGKINSNLKKDGKDILKEDFGLEILSEMKEICNYLNLGGEDIINHMLEKVKDSKLTYAYKIAKKVEEQGFVEAYINLAKEYKQSAYNNRYKLTGYEDLELSTQILIKEAIKRGIDFEVLDRKENFISLSNKNKTEYIKQATKTSKDNYSTVLMMENKIITKMILDKNNINTPKGDIFESFEDAKVKLYKYENKPVVIKPKSTNFGIGISIFPKGTTIQSLEEAVEIALKHDNSIIIEEFFEGKEFRFLVIGDEVCGILHRVPANVVGNGVNTISELVDIKNQDSLRGKGYKTPLEKIKLDEMATLFLKSNNKGVSYVPSRGEVVYLRENSNISTGGDSIDYTDIIHDKFKKIAVLAAKAIGANICGVDMMLRDYRDENSDYTIIELNFNPAIHIHSFPYKGEERNIAVKIIQLLGLI